MEQHLVNVTLRRSDSKPNMCTSLRVLCANPLERAPNVWPGSSLVINCWGPISAHTLTLLVYSTSNSAMRKSRPYWGLESILTGMTLQGPSFNFEWMIAISHQHYVCVNYTCHLLSSSGSSNHISQPASIGVRRALLRDLLSLEIHIRLTLQCR